MNLSPIDVALQTIQKCMEQDENTVDQFNGLQSNNSGHYHFGRGWRRSRLTKKSQVKLPNAIAEHCKKMQRCCYGGLLKEIHYAWISVDKRLFLWNYEKKDEWIAFDELKDVIVTVGIAKPKKGLFIQEVKHVLIVVTRLEIQLFGLGFGPQGQGPRKFNKEIYVYPSDYRVSTDGELLNSVIASDEGRIFLCGSKGSVFEFTYDVQCDWLGNPRRKVRKVDCSTSIFSNFLKSTLPFAFGGSEDPITKIVLDEFGPKTYIYALTKSGQIQVYLVPKRNGQVTHEVSSSNILKTAELSLNGEQRKAFAVTTNTIVSIAPISQSESSSAHIVAFTRHGDRIFLRRSNHSLSVVFVRLRPPYVEAPRSQERHMWQPLNTPHSPQRVHLCSQGDGVTIIVDRRTPGQDTLIAFSRDPIKTNNNNLAAPRLEMNELVEKHDVDNRLIVFEELPLPIYNDKPLFFLYHSKAAKNPSKSHKPLVGLNFYSIQHLIKPRRFLGLTSTSFLSYKFTRPVDELKSLLKNAAEGSASSERDLLTYFETHGPIESCAMCLIIACSNPSHSYDGLGIQTGDGLAIDAAVKAFLKYGQINFNSNLPMNYGDPGINNDVGLTALYKYLSRIIRPVWDWTITKKQGLGRVLRFKQKDLQNLQDPIIRFQTFLKEHDFNNMHPNQLLNPNSFNAFNNLSVIVNRCVEGFYLLQIMAQPNIFESVSKKLDQKNSSLLAQLTFHALVTTEMGREFCRSFILGMIRLGLDKQQLESLSERCPTFFHDSVHLIFEANKIIEELKTVNDKWKSDQLKDQAIQLYKRACDQPGFDLRKCCDTLRCAHLFYDVVELVDHYVDKMQHNFNQVNRMPKDLCYQEILSCFELILQQNDQIMPQNGEQYHPVPPKKQEELLKQTIARALSIDKIDFLRQFYDTLLKLNALHYVFGMRPKHLVVILQEPPRVTDPLEMEFFKKKIKKLIEYFEYVQEHRQKMELLQRQAHGSMPSYTLRERVDFLIAAKSAGVLLEQVCENENEKAKIIDEVQRLEGKIKAGNLQIEMWLAIMERANGPRPQPTDKITAEELNSQILDVHSLHDKAIQNNLYRFILETMAFHEQQASSEGVTGAWEGIIREQVIRADSLNARAQWLDGIFSSMSGPCRKWTQREETFWLVPYKFLLLTIERFDYMLHPDGGVDCVVSKLLTKLGVPLLKILNAYTSIIDRLGVLDSALRERMLNVVVTLLDKVQNDMNLKTTLSVTERQQVEVCTGLIRLIHNKTRDVVSDDRDKMQQVQTRAQPLLQVYDQLSKRLQGGHSLPF